MFLLDITNPCWFLQMLVKSTEEKVNSNYPHHNSKTTGINHIKVLVNLPIGNWTDPVDEYPTCGPGTDYIIDSNIDTLYILQVHPNSFILVQADLTDLLPCTQTKW